ncbi:MAG: zinc transporter ZntB, partial [Coxiellaceae bacterium]|nr:zinc transporter ZntB [Coxiellaceae bacterium]
DQGALWVHLNYQSKKSVNWLKKEASLHKVVANALVAQETRPRSASFSDGLLIFLRGVNLNPGQDPEDMVSIRLWIESSRIISTRLHRLLSVEDLCKRLDEGIGPKTTSELFVMLNDRLIDRMSDVLEGIDDDVDRLEEEVLNAQSHLLRPQVADLRFQAILIRRYLSPQREALSRLQNSDTPILTESDKIQLREASDRTTRYIEDLDSARDRLAIIQEELSSRLSEQLDKRMYLLSIVAVIFLPLTFITGLLGINVGGIPGSHFKWAFTIVCAGLIGLFGLTLWVCRIKKWI